MAEEVQDLTTAKYMRQPKRYCYPDSPPNMTRRNTQFGISNSNLLTIKTCRFYTIYAYGKDNKKRSSLQLMVVAIIPTDL